MLTSKALQPSANRPVAPAFTKPPAAPLKVPPVLSKPAPSDPAVPAEDAQQNNPLRKLSFYFGLAFLFMLFGVVPEVVFYTTNVNTYLLYWVAPPAILGAFMTGGIRRAFRYRASWYWVAFFAWMVLSVPFSSWRGGSTARVMDYARIPFLLLFVAGGLATTWKEMRAIFYTIAAAGVFNLLTAKLFVQDVNGRLTLDASGTIGNSNDLAAHLILVIPFIIYVVMDKKSNTFLRAALLPPIAYGVWVITGTASRGALIALSVMFVFILWRATASQRAVVLAAGVVLAGLSILLLPGATLNRLGSLFGEQHLEAEESAESRGYLFRTSLRYTREHPLFGVGPDQFSTFEGKESRSEGQIGAWHATHCSWTQVSSECGIPALIFFALGLGSAFLLVHKTWRQARRQGFTEIANMCFCYSMGMVGFLVAITFLANAYRFYFPVLIGLAICLRFVALRQMSTQSGSGIPGMSQRFAGPLPAPYLAAR
jgi:putative inorganic carbon (hco3(-)) transporter